MPTLQPPAPVPDRDRDRDRDQDAAPRVFDRALLARRKARALARREPGADFLLAHAVDDLADRLAIVTRSFATAVDLGGHTGRMHDVLARMPGVKRAVRVDVLTHDTTSPGAHLVADDAFPPFAGESLDLVVSALSLQLVNDLPGALIQIRRALKPDGLFLAALLGGETLHELKDVLMRAELEVTGGAAPRVAPFADTRALGALLQRAGFALPVADVDRVTVRYGDILALLGDLRAMGAANALTERSRRPLPRAVLARAAELYASDHADADGRLRATFDIVSLSGWAPHESQQKPLAPGSAKTRLSDALDALDRRQDKS
ncbi:methyltransferase domain-containing protein [Stappia sp. ES.058]|uniref:methyltransferase domain-containing protein n=1 Tax=Stappia sp. ES.058 TaxID=1881061 RepID=UPI0008795743|nr:methyltransferase domain-containing protein [Stappia sp. ES.058]SDU37752.1 Methyltransferase domain-containing protein [Stappia sp. ES.058]